MEKPSPIAQMSPPIKNAFRRFISFGLGGEARFVIFSYSFPDSDIISSPRVYFLQARKKYTAAKIIYKW